jgi:ornithine cyclodeaminase/alanine dehydrogenase-like protein (mu-crystallin family)
MKIRVVNSAAVRELLPMRHCIALMRQAMVLVARGEAVQPLRQRIRLPEGSGLLGWMPGYLAVPQWLGVKVVSIFAGNCGTAFGSHQGMVLLFDTQHGTPKAIVDAQEVTAIRTAAATAAATDTLGRHDATSLAVFGSGEQARQHLRALPLVVAEDLIAADYVLAEAKRRNLGQLIEW